jgi:hypothetical protein
MRKGQASLPLAFVLAMAADASAATPTDVNDKAIPIEAGALRKLLDRAIDANIITRDMDQSGDRRLPGDKTAQFFPNFPNFPNFFNCFNGSFRNC